MSSQIHINDIGTELIVTIKDDGAVVDISGASTMTIVIKKPDGESLTKTASLYTDGTDGKMEYITQSGDIDQAGLYKIQGIVVLDSGTFHTSISSFQVHCNL